MFHDSLERPRHSSEQFNSFDFIFVSHGHGKWYMCGVCVVFFDMLAKNKCTYTWKLLTGNFPVGTPFPYFRVSVFHGTLHTCTSMFSPYTCTTFFWDDYNSSFHHLSESFMFFYHSHFVVVCMTKRENHGKLYNSNVVILGIWLYAHHIGVYSVLSDWASHLRIIITMMIIFLLLLL